MVYVIKSGDIRSQNAAPTLTRKHGDLEDAIGEQTAKKPSPEELYIKALEQRLTELEEEITTKTKAIEESYERGFEEGKAEQEEAFNEDRSEALATLKLSLGKILESLDVHMSELNDVALKISSVALGKIIGDDNARQEILAAAIRQQFQTIGKDNIVAIKLSKLDFPNSAELDVLAEQLHISPAIIQTLVELDSGGCLINLNLGTVDAGLQTQLENLFAIFEQNKPISPDA
ncbi:MAG: hypothetical protein HC843_11055 [Sphingomonadales bacterium]|nr:hypothetical protein [Sphingomonadales bacterium]